MITNLLRSTARYQGVRWLPRRGAAAQAWPGGVSRRRSPGPVRALLLAALLSLPGLAAADAEADYQRGMESYQVRGDVVGAMQAFRSAAEQGHAQAQVRLAYILDAAGADAEAVAWLRRAAEQGDPEGQFRLARMLSEGEGTERQTPEAVELYRAAAENGYTQALVVLAEAHERGLLGLERNPERALALWRRAAEAGENEALHRLQRAYQRGELGLDPDPAMAAQWRERIEAAQRAAEAKQ